MVEKQSITRRRLMKAALKRFADAGYAATSVQDIVTAARVTKPVLYYHFGNKALLYKALVDHAHDERYRLILEASSRATSLKEQLEEILTALFDFLTNNREVMRLAFATAFAAPREIPPEGRAMDKGRRNFEFIQSLIERAQTSGELSSRLSSNEMTLAFYGLMNIHVMTYLVTPSTVVNRETALRAVELFFHGVQPPQA